MTELEQVQKKLAEAECKLKQKEYDWFVLRYVVTPSVIALVAVLVALTIALVKHAGLL